MGASVSEGLTAHEKAMIMRKQFSAPIKLQSGISLIEVLITILVLSVGLLGMAGLQIAAVQQNSSAGLRSQAITLAYDMADRVKVNKEGRARVANLYTFAITDTAPTAPGGSDPVDEQNAFQDLTTWLADLGTQLPSGDGSIAFTADNEQMIITVCWLDTRADGDAVIDPVASAAACNNNQATFFQFSTNI